MQLWSRSLVCACYLVSTTPGLTVRLFSQSSVNSVESCTPCLGVSPVTMTLTSAPCHSSPTRGAFAAVSTLATLALLKVSSFISHYLRMAVRQSVKDLVICSIMFWTNVFMFSVKSFIQALSLSFKLVINFSFICSILSGILWKLPKSSLGESSEVEVFSRHCPRKTANRRKLLLC